MLAFWLCAAALHISCSKSTSTGDQAIEQKGSKIPFPNTDTSKNTQNQCDIIDTLEVNHIYRSDKNTLFMQSYCTNDGVMNQWRDESGYYFSDLQDATYQTSPTQGPDFLGNTSTSKIEGFYHWQAVEGNILHLNLDGESQRLNITPPSIVEMDIESDTFDFDKLCFSNDPVYFFQRSLVLEILHFNKQLITVSRSCGTVNLTTFAPTGERKWSLEIFRQDSNDSLFALASDAFILPIENNLYALTRYGKSSDPNGFKNVLINNDGKIIKESILPWPQAKISPSGIAQCEDRIYVAGSLLKKITPKPNDTKEYDIWLAAIDAKSLAYLGETTLDVDKDDTAFAITCDASGIYLTGEVAKHHVDSGSWDGGGQVFVARFQHDFSLEEITSFGTDRLESGRSIIIGGHHLMIGGVWQGVPNNHLPESEIWARGFTLTLPKVGFSQIKVNSH